MSSQRIPGVRIFKCFHYLFSLHLFADVPSTCGKPKILDWTPTFVDISWSGPIADGGAPITHYILEMKETTMREWAENCSLSVNEIELEGDLFRGRCENLQEECQYRFRVVAVNKAGRSPTGPSSESVVAMHKNISPFIKVCQHVFYLILFLYIFITALFLG